MASLGSRTRCVDWGSLMKRKRMPDVAIRVARACIFMPNVLRGHVLLALLHGRVCMHIGYRDRAYLTQGYTN